MKVFEFLLTEIFNIIMKNWAYHSEHFNSGEIMALSIGIVGLPNVGKSTLFNALTKAQNAQAANYPFCTIEPNTATVPVPDKRLGGLAEIVKPQRILNAMVEFVDIAGLVRGASKGEGLGNQFLANIRECSAILHVVRCFEDENVTHVDGTVDPERDIETIETELIIADMQVVTKRADKLAKQIKADKEAAKSLEECKKLLDLLNQGNMASKFEVPEHNEHFKQIWSELALLTAKKVIYCANVDEQGLEKESVHLEKLRELAKKQNVEVVVVCANLEAELQGLSVEEQTEMLNSYGIEESSLVNVIRSGYNALGLCSYFTAGVQEVRAWTFQAGWKAPQCAAVIHTDFEKGFIRAEVIGYDDYIKHRSESACRNAGVLRVEGKEYVVQDGDVMHFLFNV